MPRMNPNVRDRQNGGVHAPPSPIQDAVTFCGQTDWFGQKQGEDTADPIDCNLCLDLMKHGASLWNARKKGTR